MMGYSFYQQPIRPDELYHFGIKGMHWGVRRYQQKDGSLTSAGKKRYDIEDKLFKKKYESSTTRKLLKSGELKKAKVSADLDKKISNYRNEQSNGKRAVKAFLLGPSGALTYDMARSMNRTRVGAFTRSVIDINVGSIGGHVVGNKVNNKLAVDAGNGFKIRTTGSNLAGAAARYGTDKAIADSGAELSLQQRYLRNKYIKKKGRGRY